MYPFISLLRIAFFLIDLHFLKNVKVFYDSLIKPIQQNICREAILSSLLPFLRHRETSHFLVKLSIVLFSKYRTKRLSIFPHPSFTQVTCILFHASPFSLVNISWKSFHITEKRLSLLFCLSLCRSPRVHSTYPLLMDICVVFHLCHGK